MSVRLVGRNSSAIVERVRRGELEAGVVLLPIDGENRGVRLRPRVEVELKDIALRLVAAGIGDTYLPSAYTRADY